MQVVRIVRFVNYFCKEQIDKFVKSILLCSNIVSTKNCGKLVIFLFYLLVVY